MNGLTWRMEDALRTGYLLASQHDGDRFLPLWGAVAQAEGFPAVLVSPEPAGTLISVTCDNGEPVQMVKAGKIIGKTLKHHRDAAMKVREQDSSILAGPFPPAVADALARKLARLSGATFPVPGYEEILAALRAGELT